jgi:hypothetical protein
MNKDIIKTFIKIYTIIGLIFSLVAFYNINYKNYIFLTKVKKSIVQHPENLPTKEIAKATSL